MPNVRISYSPNLAEVGTVREAGDEEARELVRTGRAVLVEDADVLEALTKADLAAKASELGAEVPSRASKADLVEVVQDAQSGQG